MDSGRPAATFVLQVSANTRPRLLKRFLYVDASEEKAIKNIEEFGCHVLHVMEEDDYPGFAYSIGIEKSCDQPEIIVTGLKQEISHWIVNEYNNRIKTGAVISPDTYYSGFLEGFDVVFKEVDKKHYADYFGWGNWFYKGNSFRVLQLIYPSTSGVWPWDEEAQADYTWFIPQLYAD